MLVDDSKQHRGFWTKPRPWVFFVIGGLAVFNLTLGPSFFYDLGVKYKERGWLGASRFLLTMSSMCNPWSSEGKKASAYMRARLPKHDIPQEAQSRNIDGYNLDAAGDKAKATEIFSALIHDYPDFEWPYNNLACIKLDEGNVDEARTLAEAALRINPDYANAHATLAQALRTRGNTAEAEAHEQAAGKLLARTE